MKKSFLLLILLALSQIVFSNPNYKNGNGTIIFSKNEDGVKTTIRKCEIDAIEIGDLLSEKNRDIFADYNFSTSIGKLKNDDIVKVIEVCTIEYLNKPKDKWNNPNGELWYKIIYNHIEGCICVSPNALGEEKDPYFNNNYEVLEEINNGKKWTVRKLNQVVSVWENLNIRDNPGTEKSNVIYTIRPRETDPFQTNVDVIAITEEKETIDGKTDYWLKIKYKNYEGWIFGGYASVERGGPKYYLPEAMIDFDLSWY